jgi:hypothetical protein
MRRNWKRRSRGRKIDEGGRKRIKKKVKKKEEEEEEKVETKETSCSLRKRGKNSESKKYGK